MSRQQLQIPYAKSIELLALATRAHITDEVMSIEDNQQDYIKLNISIQCSGLGSDTGTWLMDVYVSLDVFLDLISKGEMRLSTSMLSNTLVANEVKNAAGTEEEFERLSSSERSTEFLRVGETPSYPHRIKISHQELGSGVNKRRRSLLRFEKTVAGQVDTTAPMKCSYSLVADIPVGNMSSSVLPKDVCANIMSFLASLGASTTILYDGTGNGAKTLSDGTL